MARRLRLIQNLMTITPSLTLTRTPQQSATRQRTWVISRIWIRVCELETFFNCQISHATFCRLFDYFSRKKKLNQLFIFLRGSRCQAKNKRRNRWQNWRLWRSNQQMSWRPPGKRVTYLFFIKFESILNSFFFKASRKGKTVWNS